MDKSYFCPQDLLIEILSWLPVISLLRFRCVCKSWLSLFANPDFVNKHISQDYDDSHRKLLVRRHHNIFDLDSRSFSSLSYRTLDVVREHSGLPFTNKHEILGSYNGVVCLAHETLHDVMFWNPATRRISLVPKSGIPGPPGRCYWYKIHSEHGFGYDFKTKDYKVFKIITAVSSRAPLSSNRVQQTEVYSSRTDSWKKIDNNVIPDGFRVDDCHCDNLKVCINGIYRRLVYRYNNDGVAPVYYYLLKFDMSDEVSILTPMPDALDFGYDISKHAMVTSLSNAVALITCQNRPSQTSKCFEIFILNEYGPSGTWTKLYSVRPLSNITLPLVFRKKNELLFKNIKGELVLYDCTTNESNILKIGASVFLQVLEYKESLVSFNIKGDDQFP